MTPPRACLAALLILLPALAAAQVAVPPDADPRVRQIVTAVSEPRLRALATRLVSFGTRESMSSTTSPTRGIGAARQWILDELTTSSPRLQVSFDTHVIAPQGRFTRQTELRNVMAVLPGRSARRIYITGHYDSLNLGSGGQQALNATGGQNPQARADFDHDAEAPGRTTTQRHRAHDGTGAVFARAACSRRHAVFICWMARGLVGSAAHAQVAAAKVPVEANFNNDIVGNIHTATASWTR
jgi:anti-sigma factor RsiW